MTVVVERAIVAVVKVKAPSHADAERALAKLRDRIEWNLPATRVSSAKGAPKVDVVSRDVTLRSVSIRGAIGKAPA